MANNRISTAKRVFILAALSEGTPINAVCRILSVGKHAVLRVMRKRARRSALTCTPTFATCRLAAWRWMSNGSMSASTDSA